MKKILFILLFCCYGFAQTHTFCAQDIPSTCAWTNSHTFSQPVIHNGSLTVNSTLNVSGLSIFSTTNSSSFNGPLGLITPNSASLTTLVVSSLSTLTGGISTPKIDNVLWVDGTTFTTIAACYAAIPAGGGTCMVPPNYTETLAANLVLSKNNSVIQFAGNATITLNAFNIQVPQGAEDISIISPFAHSTNQAGSARGVYFQGYSGAGAAFDIGSSLGFTYNTLIRGVAVDLFSAQAGAIAFRATNEVQGAFDDDSCIEGPVSGQKCFATVGTGAFFSGLMRILSPECSAAPGATNNFCIQFGAISNDNTIVGGHANVLGSGANGSVCIDVSGATSANNYVIGFDCDTGVTAVTVESAVNGGLKGVVNIDSGVTNIANFGAGSFGNVITTNANLPFTDSGTAGTNSIINPARNNFRTDVWQVFQTASSYLLETLGAGAYVPLAISNGGSFTANSFTGSPTRFNMNSGCGLALGNEGTQVVAWDCNGTEHPFVAGAIGKGTTALPFLNFFLGTAATNNFKLQPAATTGSRIITIADPLSPTTVGLPLTIGSGTASMTTAGITTGACGTTVTVVVTGVLTTDVVSFTRNAAATIGNGGGLTLNAWPTAGNVNFNYCNSAAGTITPTATTINWIVVR